MALRVWLLMLYVWLANMEARCAEAALAALCLKMVADTWLPTMPMALLRKWHWLANMRRSNFGKD